MGLCAWPVEPARPSRGPSRGFLAVAHRSGTEQGTGSWIRCSEGRRFALKPRIVSLGGRPRPLAMFQLVRVRTT